LRWDAAVDAREEGEVVDEGRAERKDIGGRTDGMPRPGDAVVGELELTEYSGSSSTTRPRERERGRLLEEAEAAEAAASAAALSAIA